jgi:hypothetical protein
MADDDNNNNSRSSSSDDYTGHGEARKFYKTNPKYLSSPPENRKIYGTRGKAKLLASPVFIQAAAAAKTAKENEILQQQSAATGQSSEPSPPKKKAVAKKLKAKRKRAPKKPANIPPPPAADPPGQETNPPPPPRGNPRKKAKPDSPPLFTNKDRRPEDMRPGFTWVWNDQRGCWMEIEIESTSDKELPPKEEDSDGQSVQSEKYYYEDDDNLDVDQNETYIEEPQVAQVPSAVHFLPTQTIDLADPSILANLAMKRVPKDSLVSGKHMLAVIEFGPNANRSNIYEAYEITVVYIVVYTVAETGSVLIEKIADVHNESDGNGYNKYPMFAMIHPKDFPQGVYVLTNAGARFLDEKVRQAILSAGHSLNMDDPNTPFKSPGDSNNQPITKESNPSYNTMANHASFANPQMQEFLRNHPNHTTMVQQLNWLTAACNRNHDHVNLITEGTLKVSTVQQVHSYAIVCESYNDKFKEWGVIKCVHALPLMFQGSFAPSITFLDGKPSRLTLDFFAPVKQSNNPNQADPTFEYVTTQSLAIRNINNLLQFIAQIFRFKNSSEPTAEKFWSQFLNGLTAGINYTGKYCIDGLLGKQINELVNTAIADIFDAIHKNAIAFSIGATKPPLPMEELLVLCIKIGTEATSAAKFKELHMMRAHDMVSKPELSKLTISGKTVKFPHEQPYAKPVYQHPQQQRASGYFQSSQRDADGNYYRYPHNRNLSTFTRSHNVPPGIERSVAVNRSARETTSGGGQTSRSTQPINRTPPGSDSVCLSHLATGLKIPGAIACKRPVDCKMHHIAIPDSGGKFTYAAKNKILSTVESRYPGTTPFKTQLLEAVSQL